jgi:hypothetical protein
MDSRSVLYSDKLRLKVTFAGLLIVQRDPATLQVRIAGRHTFESLRQSSCSKKLCAD